MTTVGLRQPDRGLPGRASCLRSWIKEERRTPLPRAQIKRAVLLSLLVLLPLLGLQLQRRVKAIQAQETASREDTLALMEATGDGALAVRREETFKSPEHPSLEEIVRRFLGGEKVALAGASFGVAGAIIDGRCKTNNLAWTEMSEASLAKAAICGCATQLGTKISSRLVSYVTAPGFPMASAKFAFGELRMVRTGAASPLAVSGKATAL